VTSFSGESVGAKTANKEADLVRKSRPQWVCQWSGLLLRTEQTYLVSAIMPLHLESSTGKKSSQPARTFQMSLP
jgi:hypothetical protein